MSDNCCTNELSFTLKQLNKIKGVLWVVFALNLGMFFVEIVAGFLAKSSALTADSLDMLADAFVYGLSLYVINDNHVIRARASLAKGVLMGLIGLFVVGESIFKIFNATIPIGEIITTVGIFALLANFASFVLLIKHKNSDLNLKSAWLCSRNDITSNVAVIFAGFLVLYLQSNWPDIIVGLGISVMILQSSFQIIKESLVATRHVSLVNYSELEA